MKKHLCAALCSLGMLLFTGCGSSDKGYVYYLNFKPEADSAWQTIAREYTELTGVEVKVITAASSTYGQTLSSQMNKTMCPTLFVCSGAQDFNNWDDYCYDLRGSAIADKVEDDTCCVYSDTGELKGIGYCYEAYGLIVNVPLLEKAGYKVEDINCFAALRNAAEDIHSRRDELGFDAFTSSGLDASSSWRFSSHLANLPLYYQFEKNGIVTQPSEITNEYLWLYRNVWDLYIGNSSTEPSELAASTGVLAETEFGSGEAVFFQNGSWEFSSLTSKDTFGLDPDDLRMIPIYCGAEGEENRGLCCGTQNYWAVNSRADQKDIDATLEFLDWVITSDTGREMLEHEFGITPFKDHIETNNSFLRDAENYARSGKENIPWRFTFTPNLDVWREGVVSALLGYSAGKNSWETVENAFVNGWSYQYKLEHCIL